VKRDFDRGQMLNTLSSLTFERGIDSMAPSRANYRQRVLFMLGACVVAAALAGASFATLGQSRRELDAQLVGEVGDQAAAFSTNVQRTRATTLLTAQDPSLQEFYKLAGDRETAIKTGGPVLNRVHTVLSFLEVAYPDRIGEVCFIDLSGAENARVVKGVVAEPSQLSTDETGAEFFKPTITMAPGDIYRSSPYRSPDTGEWVVSQSTPVADDNGTRAIFHVEMTIEGLRMDWASRANHRQLYAIDGRTGTVVIDSEVAQGSADLGRATDRTFVRVTTSGSPSGLMTLGGQRVAYERLDAGPNNGSDWYLVVASEPIGIWTGRSVVAKAGIVLFLALIAGLLAWIAAMVLYRRMGRRIKSETRLG
jgi:hypothetical protein